MHSLEEQLAEYRQQHRTIGCKVCHLIGVPMIAMSAVMLFFNPRRALKWFLGGCFFQLAGHLLFEHNRPLLTKDPGNSLTYMSALLFVAEEWTNLLTGHLKETPADPDPNRIESDAS